ncbi:MAG: biopolymer transporter ExbD [Candidatus Omnitrophica bacterium]|nr:biopolymer transporter ExbD [Candidatus Omnitrophota bacterium]
MEFIRPKKISLSFDMAPLIDIVFQLLIFFMLSSSFLNPALKLSLPKAQIHDSKEPQQMVVSIDREGKVFVNKNQVSMTHLKTELERRLIQDSKKSVHIRGDQEMAYKYFVQVIDLARQAGAKQVNIVHEDLR